MRPSHLSLEDYFVTELYFAAVPEFGSSTDGSKLSPTDLDVKVQRWAQQEAPSRRSCNLTIELKESPDYKFPWIFRITLVGFFEVIEGYPYDIEKLVHANAPAILYSAAREALASVSGRGPYPEVLLPSVTFVELSFEKNKPAENQLQLPPLTQEPAQEETISSKKQAGKKSRTSTKV